MYGADSPHSSITTRAVGAPTTPSITTTSLPSVEVHVPYQATFLAAGGEVTWSAVGALPPGLTLSLDGVLTGTPSQAGTWEVGVRASNARARRPAPARHGRAGVADRDDGPARRSRRRAVPTPPTPRAAGRNVCTPCQVARRGRSRPARCRRDGLRRRRRHRRPAASDVTERPRSRGSTSSPSRGSWTGGRGASS